jgi:hypothetical protein
MGRYILSVDTSDPERNAAPSAAQRELRKIPYAQLKTILAHILSRVYENTGEK